MRAALATVVASLGVVLCAAEGAPWWYLVGMAALGLALVATAIAMERS